MMIFDPCGDLLKDYGAFCESLRVTEREDVYSAIGTRVVQVPPLPADAQERSAGAGDGAEKRPGSAETKGSRPSSKGVSKEKDKAGTAAAAGGGTKRKSVRKASQEAAAAVTTAAEEEAPPPPEMPTITYVSLHYPVFCLNQRDMTPLSRAIPHCPSLLSVELVGCGLSVQGYMQLVDAVYRSPRILSVAVDFNRRSSGVSAAPAPGDRGRHAKAVAESREQAGFVADPTLRSAAAAALGESPDPGSRSLSFVSGNSQERPFTTSTTTQRPGSNAGAASAVKGSGGRGGGGKATLTPNSRVSQSGVADTPPSVAVGDLQAPVDVAAEDEDVDGRPVMYFYPTQYCGLDQLPTPLELQLQEETEKKGKVDGKRLQQVQAQRDAMRAFNDQNRMAIPRTWDGLLYTGIRFLSLRGNGIDDAAVTRLVHVLLHNPRSQLESINLWGNNITDVGAAALAQLLQHSRDIRVLDVGNNELSDTGLLEIVDTLRMQQLTSPEEVLAARRAYLTRRGATDEERKAAGQPLLITDIPSYEDLYAFWWYTQQQQQQQQQQASSPRAADGMSNVCRNLSLSSALYPPPPPPPQRDATLSPSAANNAKRASPAKGKTTKSESVPNFNGGAAASAAATLSSSAARAAMRPTAAFDRDCIRVCHLSDNDPAIRVPGNAVLEVLNLEENRHVTVVGVREAVRRLTMREPAVAAEMLAMVETRDVPAMLSLSTSVPLSVTSASPESSGKRLSGASHRGASVAAAAVAACHSTPTPSTVIRAPELHCAGLRLRVCALRCHREAARGTWLEMDEVQQRLSAFLTQRTTVPASVDA